MRPWAGAPLLRGCDPAGGSRGMRRWRAGPFRLNSRCPMRGRYHTTKAQPWRGPLGTRRRSVRSMPTAEFSGSYSADHIERRRLLRRLELLELGIGAFDLGLVAALGSLLQRQRAGMRAPAD